MVQSRGHEAKTLCTVSPALAGDFEMIKYITDMSRCIWQRAKKKPHAAVIYNRQFLVMELPDGFA